VSSDIDDLSSGQTTQGFAIGQKVFERYTIRKKLGGGAMGVVWLAHDEELGVDVALKFLPESLAVDRGALKDLKRETRRSRELSHKNIVKVYQFESKGERAAISMEYVDGQNLANLKEEQPGRCFSHNQLEPWLAEICDALDYAHSDVKIVHRDLKPANLMLNSKEDLKVADFGIARSLTDSVSMLTMARGTSGTLVYMSPQQIDGKRASHLDDIYSLGATIYDLLTSKPPFYSGAIEHQIKEISAPSMTERRYELGISGDAIPLTWEQTIAACLAKEPSQRPQSAGEIAERLGLKEPAARAPRVHVAASARGKPMAPVVAATVALLLVLAGVGYYFLRSHAPAVVGGVQPVASVAPSTPGIARASMASQQQAPAPVGTTPWIEQIPPLPQRYFNDYAGVISSDAASQFNEQLAQFERETSNQVVVAIFPKMESDSDIADYTLRIAQAWGVGQKERRNGVVLFVFVKDRRMFMQVGFGLEDVLTNTKAFDIVEHQIKPHFRSGDYEGGIRDGINAVLEATRAKYKGTGKTVGEAGNHR
jgi:hypothetical protein